MNKSSVVLLSSVFLFLALQGCSSDKNGKTVTNKTEIKAKSVKVIEVKKSSFKSTRRASGSSQAIADITISSQANGNLTFVAFKEGDQVTKSVVLGQVDPVMASAQLKAAKTGYEAADYSYKVTKNLFDKKLASEQQLQQVKASLASTKASYELAELQFDNTNIKSPIKGIIAESYVDKGEFVTVGRPVFRVIDISKIKVIVGIAGQDLPNIKINDNVNVIFPAISSKPFIGQINTIGSLANNDSKTFPVEIVIENTDQSIKPGMLCNVQFVLKEFKDIFVVPQDIILNDTIKSVFVVRENRAYKHKIYVLGMENDLAAISGIRENEQLVVVGQEKLSHNELVKIVQ